MFCPHSAYFVYYCLLWVFSTVFLGNKLPASHVFKSTLSRTADLPREKSSVLKYQEILLAAKVDKSKSYRELPSYYMAFSLFFSFSLIFYLNKDFAGQVTVICLHAAG